MSKNAVIHARVESALKQDVDSILSQLGINATQAITIFYEQIRMRKGLPFTVEIPNQTTRKAMQDVENNQNLSKVDLAELSKEVIINSNGNSKA